MFHIFLLNIIQLCRGAGGGQQVCRGSERLVQRPRARPVHPPPTTARAVRQDVNRQQKPVPNLK